MAIRTAQVSISTRQDVEVVNVTRQVAAACRDLGVSDGLLLLSIRHTTCALCINEDEEGLRQDIERMAATLLEPLRRKGGFRHDRIDDNAQAHLTAILIGHSASLPFVGGKMVLGSWQSVLLVEMDGPRDRCLDITAVGE